MNQKIVKLAKDIQQMPPWARYLLIFLFIAIIYAFYLEIHHMKNANNISSSCPSCPK